MAESADAADLKSAGTERKCLSGNALENTGGQNDTDQAVAIARLADCEPSRRAVLIEQLLSRWRVPESAKVGIVAMIEAASTKQEI